MSLERTVIGVDIGGTKVAAAVLRGRVPSSAAAVREETPRIIARFTAPTDQSSPDACLGGIVALVARLAERAGGADAIGVGVASMVDFGAGRIIDSVNLPLTDVPLRDLLQERFGVPVVVDNDATAAAVGEHIFGAGVGVRDMLLLTLGTGVGGGIICDGRPYRGHSGAAAELGHMIVDLNGPKCPAACPNHGCLEAYVSGTALGAKALAEAKAAPSSGLGRALAAGRTVDSRLLVELAQAGDAHAAGVLRAAGEILGAAFVTLVNIFNPELLVIGGGLAAAGDLLLTPAREVLAARALPPGRDEVRVVPAAFGADAGFIGAAALGLTALSPQEPCADS